MKKLPLGIQTFAKIIEEDLLYVDKTKYLYELISAGSTYYFISRPRRFGKSLMISTLKEIFSGNKELFKDLWIYDKINWKKHPIVHLDFNGLLYTEGTKGLKDSLFNTIVRIASEYQIKLTKSNYKEAFGELLQILAKKEKVVILVDEYDKPIINFIEEPEKAKEMRNILKDFYVILKESDQYIRFALLTGVSKFSKVSIFSDLNNLRDLTLEEDFSSMFGYTQKEMDLYFSEYLESFTKKLKKTKTEVSVELKNWYNGYSWDGENFVYNPFSILSLFTTQKINNYWFQSGTPTFLIKAIKEHQTKIPELEYFEADEALLDSFTVEQMNVESLLFQTGYLTIKKVVEYSISSREYILSYPNLEVKNSLLENILADYTAKNGTTGVIINKLVKYLLQDSVESFVETLKSLFAGIPVNLFIEDRESYYHTVIYLILSLIGVRISVEVHTNKGRIDAVIDSGKKIYVMEFKLGSAEKALEQIERKKYYESYLASGKTVTLVGIAFAEKERNIIDYLVKDLLT